MTPKESFLEKLTKEKTRRLLEEERAREKRETELSILHSRVIEEIKTKGRPFVDVLQKSKILSYLDEFKNLRPDLKIGLSLTLYYGEQYFNKVNFEFDWEKQEFLHIGIRPDDLELRLYPSKQIEKIIEKNRVGDITVDTLDIDVKWDFYEFIGIWDVSSTGYKSIEPHIEKREDGFYIKIRASELGPNDWESPEKLQDALMQEILKQD